MFYSKPYWDVLIVVLVLVLFFGPKRLPALGKSLGQGMREFKDSISGKSKDSDGAEHPELEAATAPPPAAAPQQAAPAATQPVPSAPQPPQPATEAPQVAPQPAQPGTQPTQPVPSAPQPPPAGSEPAQPATVSAPTEQSSDRGSDTPA